VGGVVEVLTAMPHAQALAYIKGADAALLLGQRGSQSVELVPAKMYDYIGAGKGVLAVAPGEEVCRIVRASGCRLWQASADGGSVARALETVLEQFAAGPLRPQTNWRQRDEFTRARTARELAELVRRTATAKTRARCP
jgi:hypothetical protein